MQQPDLLLNNDGSIYHLHLFPDEVGETIITVGDPNRVPLISKYFDVIELKRSNREFITHTGYLNKKRITVVSTGIGTGNIDIVLNELDALVNINFTTKTIHEQINSLNIIRLGTTGALQKQINTGDLIVSSFAIGLDNLLAFYKQQNNIEEIFIFNAFMQHMGMFQPDFTPYIAESSVRLRNLFVKGFHHGITLTTPGFYGPQGRRLRLTQHYTQLIELSSGFQHGEHFIANFEMETAALYALSKLMHHQCVSISTVVANRITNKTSINPDKDVEQMIKTCLASL